MEIEKIIVRRPVPMEQTAKALAELLSLQPLLQEAMDHPDTAKTLYLGMKTNCLARQVGFKDFGDLLEYVRIYGVEAL